MCRRRGFTLVELLVVVSILAVLVSILIPSISRAKIIARRTLCATNLKAIRTASASYAVDSNNYFPYRPPGGYLPHTIWVSGQFDLNETFVREYVSQRGVGMFCPGKIRQVRGPYALGWEHMGGYAYRYVTYTYFNFRPGNFGNWLLPDPYPNLATNIAPGKYALWGCLTVDKHWAYLAHDVPQTSATPDGMNATFIHGGTKWIEWADMQPFWDDTSQDFYWPIPEDEQADAGGSGSV